MMTAVEEPEVDEDLDKEDDELDNPGDSLQTHPLHILSAAHKIVIVYGGEKIHHKNGSYLDGGAKEDGAWQSRWWSVVIILL